jgi:RNA polymerase sigma-70 factor (ECF subfamily)
MVDPLPNETELARRCADGDAEAFGSLMTHYQDAIFNLVYRMIGNREDAQDVTQEAFIKAYRRIGSFEGRARFGTWMYSIAVNQAISHRRKGMAKSRAGRVQMSVLDGPGDDAAFDPPGGAPDPDDRMSRAELMRQIESAIDELADDHRAVVLLRDLEGLDYKRIGEVLDCSRGTVKSRLHRARLELRRKLNAILTA